MTGPGLGPYWPEGHREVCEGPGHLGCWQEPWACSMGATAGTLVYPGTLDAMRLGPLAFPPLSRSPQSSGRTLGTRAHFPVGDSALAPVWAWQSVLTAPGSRGCPALGTVEGGHASGSPATLVTESAPLEPWRCWSC